MGLWSIVSTGGSWIRPVFGPEVTLFLGCDHGGGRLTFRAGEAVWPRLSGVIQSGDMVLSLSISAEAEAKLREKAVAAGVDLATYASKTLERVASRPSLEEVLKPLRDEFNESGMSEEQLTEFLEEAKHDSRAERRARRAS